MNVPSIITRKPLRSERHIRAWAAHAGLKDFEQRHWLASRELFPIGGGGEVALRKTQAALEVTRGTTLAATRKVYGSGHMLKDQPLIFPAGEDRASFVEHYRSQPGLIAATFPFSGVVTYEDQPWWNQLALKGGVVGVLSALTVYTYTSVPTAGSDDLKSGTFEWGDDTQAFRGGFGMVETFELSGALGEQWKFTAGINIDDMAPVAFTAALGDRVTEDVLMHLTKFAIGAAGAVPAAYLTGRLIGFKLSVKNNLDPKFFADGAGAKYTGMGRSARHYELELTMEGNAATVTERGVFEAGTARVARLTANGSIIAGSTGNVTRSVDIVMPGVWNAFPIAERSTNTTFAAVLEAQYDATLAYDLSVAIANGLATLP